jgi:hypothetical protein
MDMKRAAFARSPALPPSFDDTPVCRETGDDVAYMRPVEVGLI